LPSVTIETTIIVTREDKLRKFKQAHREHKFVCYAQTPLIRFVVDLWYNKLYNKSTTNPQQIEEVEFGHYLSKPSVQRATLSQNCKYNIHRTKLPTTRRHSMERMYLQRRLSDGSAYKISEKAIRFTCGIRTIIRIGLKS